MKVKTALSERHAIEAARRALEVYVESARVRPVITGEAIWTTLLDPSSAIGVHVLSGEPIPRGYVVVNYKARRAIVFNALDESVLAVTWRAPKEE